MEETKSVSLDLKCLFNDLLSKQALEVKVWLWCFHNVPHDVSVCGTRPHIKKTVNAEVNETITKSPVIVF